MPDATNPLLFAVRRGLEHLLQEIAKRGEWRGDELELPEEADGFVPASLSMLRRAVAVARERDVNSIDDLLNFHRLERFLQEAPPDGEPWEPDHKAVARIRRFLETFGGPVVAARLGSLVNPPPPGAPAAPAATVEQAPLTGQGSPSDGGPGKGWDVPGKALVAAYTLRRDGLRISLKAVCQRARIDRGNLRKRHPGIVKMIRDMSTPDRAPRRGTRDRRTGEIDGVDDPED
jgi:hypothetical protein